MLCAETEGERQNLCESERLDMSAGEDQGVTLASSRFTAVNEWDRSTVVVSMNGTEGNGATRRLLPDEEGEGAIRDAASSQRKAL